MHGFMYGAAVAAVVYVLVVQRSGMVGLLLVVRLGNMVRHRRRMLVIVPASTRRCRVPQAALWMQ